MVQENFIPVIDFSRFLDGSETVKVAQELVDAFVNVGFVYLSGHGIPKEEIDRTYSLSKDFFNMSMQEKVKLAWKTPEANRGYVAPGRERVGMIGQDMQELRVFPDIKESMEIGKEPCMKFENNWPENNPEFRKYMMEFYNNCHHLNVQVMNAIGIGLGLKSGFFDKFIDAKENNLRLLHYPKVESKVLENPNQSRIGAHTDYGTVTLLFQDSVGGLQVKNTNGVFVPAPPIPGTIVVNAGDLLARWSNDKIKSTEHRVVSPPYSPVEGFYPARYSIAYFCNPNFDATIECLQGTFDESVPCKYDPINSHEYLTMRLKETY
jgi:isopenicillin N synthase-like dioxygenase